MFHFLKDKDNAPGKYILFLETRRRIIWTNTGGIENAEKEDCACGKGVYSLIENEKSIFAWVIRNRKMFVADGFSGRKSRDRRRNLFNGLKEVKMKVLLFYWDLFVLYYYAGTE